MKEEIRKWVMIKGTPHKKLRMSSVRTGKSIGFLVEKLTVHLPALEKTLRKNE